MSHTLNLDYQRKRSTLDLPEKTGIALPWKGTHIDTLRTFLAAGLRDNRTTTHGARQLTTILHWAQNAPSRMDPRIRFQLDTLMTMTDPGYAEILISGTYHGRRVLLSCRRIEEDDRKEMVLAAAHPARGSVSWTLPVAADDGFDTHLYATGWGVFAPLIRGNDSIFGAFPAVGRLEFRPKDQHYPATKNTVAA